ncbi:DUF2061 domain-containing protein [Seonamhaeicola maritimus]|uniref:DUF2061 domain-containing protein n=1 Tax=Seonamhaeicola maritimus TaxID=2591822 RepID=UPI002493D96A|nr:DUF2061 domain-containing protein [Seonamhaeicola maritimus]
MSLQKTGNSIKRHLAKTVSWRIVGTVDTFILSWIISGNPFVGLKIGLTEVITKLILYYWHERFWFKSTVKDSKKRHVYKTVTWRIIGTIDTIMVAFIITGKPLVGISIGALELISKMILYYLHEKVWYTFDFGLENRKSKKGNN